MKLFTVILAVKNWFIELLNQESRMTFTVTEKV